jgi:hypothetical protein
MIEQVLRRFLESSSRREIVITLSFLIGLAVIWPVADEYRALQNQQVSLTATLNNTRATVERLPAFQQQVDQKVQLLATLESQEVKEQDANQFRNLVVGMARQASCDVRRVQVGAATTQRWREGGNPLEPSQGEGSETPYILRSLPLTVAVAGPLENVKQLLAQLNELHKLMHTKRFILKPEGQDPKSVILELDLIMFDLELAPQKTT